MKHLLLLLLFHATLGFAQNNYQKGYIITNNFDSVFGYINLKSNIFNQEYCYFKPDDKAKPSIFKPGDIYGYRVDEKYFISKTINLESGFPQKVFLDFLVQGMMNLYYYQLDSISYYFFEDENGNLNTVSQLTTQNIHGYILSDISYKTQIYSIFEDFKPVSDHTKYLKFEQKDMVNIAQKYHDAYCTTGEECMIFKNAKPGYFPRKAKISLYSGVQVIGYDFLHSIVKKNSLVPTYGVQFDFFFPRMFGGWSFPLRLSLAHFKDSPNDRGFIGNYEYENISVNSFLFPVDVGIKHIFLQDKKIRPSLEFGITPINFYFEDNNSLLKSKYYGFDKDSEKLSCAGFHIQWLKGVFLSSGISFEIAKYCEVFVAADFSYNISSKYVNISNNMWDSLFQNLRARIGLTFL